MNDAVGAGTDAPLPAVATVVVNYGSHALLEANLVPVSIDTPDLAVVVVDNFTDTLELAAVTALCADRGWRLIASPTNLGFGAAMNLGVAAALADGADQILILNPDARIDDVSLRRLRRVVAADPMVLAAPVVTAPDGRVWSDGSDVYLDTGRMRATRKRQPGARVEPWLSGACLVMSRELWNLLGGFDDRYFLYWEDVDLSWRAREAGAELRVVREATAVHDEGGTQQESGSRSRSNTYYYYNIRNRLLFAALHLGRDDRRAWLRTAIPEAYDILLRGGRRQLVGSTAPWKAAITGTWDGVRLARRVRRSAAVSGHRLRPVRVLQSFPDPRPTTNPYIWMLRDSLAAHPDVALDTFSWPRALGGRYDVFHAHWPEILVAGRSPARKALRQLLFAVFLVRLRLSGTAVVRTLHNLELPQGISRREVVLLRLFQRWTTSVIRLNTSTDLGEQPYATIVHGHYRDWFAEYPRADTVPGRLAYFGLIRRYKAVDTLLRAFAGTADTAPELSLSVGGRPSTGELRSELETLAAADPRVHTHLEFLSDAELVEAVSAAELVVLPYREMHNSGGVLAALSLGRPVLVPDNEVNRQLAAEVGPGWILRYDPPLTGARLVQAVAELDAPRPDRPDLSGRDWGPAAQAHLTAYRQAIALRGRRPGS